MLQQAIALSLFPEHEVEVRTALPPQADAEVFDLVMMDASIDPEQVRSAASWNVPVILVGKSANVNGWGPADIVCVEPPLAKPALETAVARCLAATQNNQHDPKLHDQSRAQDREPDVIDLTEIVEDESAAKPSVAPARDKK